MQAVSHDAVNRRCLEIYSLKLAIISTFYE
jgi:hypothetical protein